MKIDYEERIQELKEQLSEYCPSPTEIDHIVKTIIMLTEQETKRKIIESIK